MTKLCECGCGKPTKMIKKTQCSTGRIAGEYSRFIKGHSLKNRPTGRENHLWKGGITTDGNGYLRQSASDHPYKDKHGLVAQHRLIVESVIGRHLTAKEEVHHVDEDRKNNEHVNLVACEDRAYHFLLHTRKRALLACGNATWKKCGICKQHDDVKNLVVCGRGRSFCHSGCRKEYDRKKYLKAKEKRK